MFFTYMQPDAGFHQQRRQPEQWGWAFHAKALLTRQRPQKALQKNTRRCVQRRDCAAPVQIAPGSRHSTETKQPRQHVPDQQFCERVLTPNSAAANACRMLRRFPEKKIPPCTALAGALLRCSSLVWLATRRSGRLALHPAGAAQGGIFFPENRLNATESMELQGPICHTSTVGLCPLDLL